MTWLTQARRWITVVLAVIGIALGLFLVRAGELDDSPGLGGIGLILAASGVWVVVRSIRRQRARDGRGPRVLR